MVRLAHRASGSGRNWNFTTFGRLSVPPSRWNMALVEEVAHSALPFQPAFGSSMRPSTHFVKKPLGMAPGD